VVEICDTLVKTQTHRQIGAFHQLYY